MWVWGKPRRDSGNPRPHTTLKHSLVAFGMLTRPHLSSWRLPQPTWRSYEPGKTLPSVHRARFSPSSWTSQMPICRFPSQLGRRRPSLSGLMCGEPWWRGEVTEDWLLLLLLLRECLWMRATQKHLILLFVWVQINSSSADHQQEGGSARDVGRHGCLPVLVFFFHYFNEPRYESGMEFFFKSRRKISICC